MFARALVVLTVAAAALAFPTKRDAYCSIGETSCCNNAQTAEQSSNAFAALLALQDLNDPVGVTCTPIPILALATAGNCNGQTACCSNNDGGAINCSPFDSQI